MAQTQDGLETEWEFYMESGEVAGDPADSNPAVGQESHERAQGKDGRSNEEKHVSSGGTHIRHVRRVKRRCCSRNQNHQ
jgi:hypothetical protein